MIEDNPKSLEKQDNERKTRKGYFFALWFLGKKNNRLCIVMEIITLNCISGELMRFPIRGNDVTRDSG